MSWAKQAGTKHAEGCRRVFSRYDADCPRCLELAEGAAPRQGWSLPQPVYRDVRTEYCFCQSTPIWADRCPRCGKHPHTD